ncbi:MAG: hypothetical protein IPP57_12210 [Candidatus Obscuribacter sp.]|nr:hypothetical protein [Candidatus Obscuribacter sp.]MDQ5967024.1 ATP-binding protein [Cyanobacteriota bacterium erpe_2018_sw_39hr_WHONDRS-SW48-000098_B_bin.30]
MLDNLDEPIDPSSLSSIAIDGLVFRQMGEGLTRQPSAEILNDLCRLNRPVAYLVYGNKKGVSYYLGLEQEAMAHLYEKQQDLLSSDQIREMIAPYLLHCSLINGSPDLPQTDTDSISTSQMSRVASGLAGSRFGLLFLALPIQPSLIAEEIAITQSRLNDAKLVENPDQKRKLKYIIEAQQQYLDELSNNLSNGYWLVGGYLFAPSPDTLTRLKSLLKANYCHTPRNNPYTTPELPEISSYIKQFGILLNLRECEDNSNRIEPRILIRYRFAATLSTSRLSTYING